VPKVLYIGHGIPPHTVGGAIQYQEDLANGVLERGWETVRYYPAPRYTLSGRLHLTIRRHGGATLVEVLNSPYLPYHEVIPAMQCRHAASERLFRETLEAERPDLIHVHELQMHPAAILDAVFAAGIPALKTQHNYYDICPQHDLMERGAMRCEDDEKGRRCVACLAGRPALHPPILHRLKRVAVSTLPPAVLDPFRRLKRATTLSQRETEKTQFRAAPSGAAPTPAAFQQRRDFFMERLNRLDLVHFSSEGAARVMRRYGLAADRIRVVPIATRLSDSLGPRPVREPRGPVVFGFMGGEHHHKGFDLLVRAFEELDPTRCELRIWNTNRIGIMPDRPHIRFMGRYAPEEIGRILAGIDVGVVPSIWEEAFGLVGTEFLSAGIPVVGSRLGGIPQWLEDGVNGLLFSPDDPADLVATLRRFVDEPGLVAAFQRRIRPWKTFSSHLDEMIGVYGDLLARARRGSV
jgi:glycosyltransferase involved in cell wall biosynthesis